MSFSINFFLFNKKKVTRKLLLLRQKQENDVEKEVLLKKYIKNFGTYRKVNKFYFYFIFWKRISSKESKT